MGCPSDNECDGPDTSEQKCNEQCCPGKLNVSFPNFQNAIYHIGTVNMAKSKSKIVLPNTFVNTVQVCRWKKNY